MNYTLHQLAIFCQVVKHQSITKAAQAMHMTQPALSIQLKNFQSQFEIPLTEVIGKKLYITDFGQSIASIAFNIINEAENLKYRTKEFSGLLTGKLHISVVSTGKYVMPFFLSQFLQDHPNIELDLDVSNKSSVIEHLKNNETDFALVSVVPENLNTQEEILLENKLYLVGSEKVMDKNKPLIYREKGSATRASMDQYYNKNSANKSLQLTSNEAVKQAVIAGIGYSILPLIGIKNEIKNEELHVIPAPGLPIITNWRLIWLKSKKLSPLAEAYLKFVRKEKYNIIQNQFKWYVEYV